MGYSVHERQLLSTNVFSAALLRAALLPRPRSAGGRRRSAAGTTGQCDPACAARGSGGGGVDRDAWLLSEMAAEPEVAGHFSGGDRGGEPLQPSARLWRFLSVPRATERAGRG